MFCPNCGKESGEGVKFCAYCGTELNNSNSTGVTSTQTNVTSTQTNSTSNPPAQQKEERAFSGFAIAGFVISLMGILFFAVVCGAIGVFCSGVALKETGTAPDKKRGGGLALAGMIISLADFIIGIIMLAI